MQSINELLYFLPQECSQDTIRILYVHDRLFFLANVSVVDSTRKIPHRRIQAPQIPKKTRVSGVNGLKMLEDLLVSTNYIEIRVSIFPGRSTIDGNVYYCLPY